MISSYLDALMRQATYQPAPDSGWLAAIPDLPDLWAQGATQDECRQELQAVLETWALEHLTGQVPLPAVNGVRLLADACASCPFTPILLEDSA